MKNQMCLEFDSRSENEAFARVVVAAFATQLNPTLEEVDDIKTVVSEAVTNAIVHGYEQKENYKVFLQCEIVNQTIQITIMDYGVGIEDVEKAKEPMFTTKPHMNRSGMGFTFMEALMDELEVYSKKGEGTTVKMKKTITRMKVC
ncbi:putative uncharacterized protein [Clostridium sp. CAG:411]|jgi:stage II sporulation protein AB (anti-sigma F factor)|nr:anti-sigma F factor [Lachnospiraceae bacterium]CDE43352.1 putative uncharacterized protein [Clostridium sp. CAG:411]